MAAIDQGLLEILRCPACVHNGPQAGLLDVHGNWLICKDCNRKYSVRGGIPVMLIEEGDKYRSSPVCDLPDPDAS